MTIHHQLCRAIENKSLIEFTYHQLVRIAEPHDYGEIQSVRQLLVYQIEGESRSSKLPDWRLMKVSEIQKLQILDRQFSGRRNVSSKTHKKWDRIFASVSLLPMQSSLNARDNRPQLSYRR